MRHRITKEIKKEIIGKIQSGERVVDLAAQYAVSSKTIYGWLRQDTGESVVSMVDFNNLKRENEELKRLIGELTLTMHVQKSRNSAAIEAKKRFAPMHWALVGKTSIVSDGSRPKTGHLNARSKPFIVTIPPMDIAVPLKNE